MRLTGIRAVFFDLDDTLCVYMPTAIRARRQTFTELIQPLVALDIETIDRVYKEVFWHMVEASRDEPWRSLYLQSGEPTRTETMRRLLLRLGIENPALAAEISRRYAELRDAYLTLFEDVLPTFRVLRPHYRLGLITNGPSDVQRQEISTLGLDAWMDVMLIEGELGVGKPDARIFRAALEAVEVVPEQAVFVGNSWENDVMGAKGVGMHAIWLNREAHPLPDPGNPPTATIQSLYELPSLLGMENGGVGEWEIKMDGGMEGWKCGSMEGWE